MAGSKRERRPGVWELRVHDPTAKSGQRSRTFHGGQREADRALAAFVTEIDQARAAAPAAGTFGDLLERWLTHCKPNVTAKTWYGYRQLADKIISDLGDLALAEVTVKRLDTYYRELLAENIGTEAKPRHRTPSTVQHYHAVIRRSLTQAARWGETSWNPAKLADPPVVRRKEIDPPSAEVADKLVRTLAEKNPDLATFIFVALATGMRRGELVALRWDDLDLEHALARVRRGVVVVGGELVEKDTKTHQARAVDLDEPTVEILRRHRARMETRAERLGGRLSRRARVFSDATDGAATWHPDTATSRWRRFTASQGHPGIRLHDLRHAMATYWLDAGVPVHVVSQRLGHAKVSTTSDIYGHVPDGSQAKAAVAMAGSLPRLELG
jgi:integrase